jgi:outer membrane protein OmpA-like peptidoglycan-associated protein
MPAVSLDIKFKINSAELSPDATGTMKQLATAIESEQLAKYHFRLEGHTDSTGTRDYNLALSERRATTVRNYLIKNYGLAPNRLEAVGRGQSQPIDPADPANPANRRVQIVNTGE